MSKQFLCRNVGNLIKYAKIFHIYEKLTKCRKKYQNVEKCQTVKKMGSHFRYLRKKSEKLRKLLKMVKKVAKIKTIVLL